MTLNETWSGPIDPKEIEGVNDAELLERYGTLRLFLVEYQKSMGRLEQEIWRRMEDRGATAIPDSAWVCEGVTSNTYNQDAFKPLLEILNSDDLEKCFTPSHPQIVPDKWTTQKVLVLAKRYGAEALAIVDRARLPGARRLKFEAKGVSS